MPASPPVTASPSTTGLRWIERAWEATVLKDGRLPMQTIDLAYVGCGIYEELARNQVPSDPAEGARHHVEAECDDEQAHAPGAVFP
jgi:hypothetical protein